MNASTDLVKGYVHPGIFEKSRPDLAQKELSKLPPREFSAVLEKLEQSGSLDRLLGQLSPDQQSAFLDTAVRKGALQQEVGKQVTGPLNPPSMPSTYAISADAPLALAQLASSSNSAVAGGFYGAQQEYLDRYETAVKGCKSGADLRKLGPHAELRSVPDGISASHPHSNGLAAQWVGAHRLPSDVRLQNTISNKLSDFMGEARAGSFFVEGKVEVEAINKSVSLDASGRIYDSGKTDGKAGGKAKLPNGALVGLDSKGTATLGVYVGAVSVAMKGEKVAIAAKTDAAQLELETSRTGKVSKLKTQLEGSGVTFDNGRGQLDVSLFKKTGGYGFYDPSKSEFGGGVKGKLGSGEDGISFQAGMGMQGLSRANAKHALNPFGIHATPPELTQGKEWKDLNPTAQDAYRRRGWTEQEWSSKVNSRG